MELLETILSLGTTLTLTQLSWLSPALYTSAWPRFPFYFHSPSNSAPEFLSSWASVFLFSTFSSLTVLLQEQQAEYALDSRTLGSRNLYLSLNVQLTRAQNIMNNNYRASYCNNTHGLTRCLNLYCRQPQLPTAIIHCFRHLIGNTKAAHAPANAHSVSSPQRSHQDTFKVSPHRGTGGTGPFNVHLSPS